MKAGIVHVYDCLCILIVLWFKYTVTQVCDKLIKIVIDDGF